MPKRTTINELIRFEHLLSEISATYINIDINTLEKVIKSDLERLGRLLGAQRCLLYLASEDRLSFKFGPPYIWWTDEDSEIFVHDSGFQMAMDGKPDGVVSFFSDLQYLFEKWAKGENVQFSSPEELPAEAERIKLFYNRFNVKSFLSIPVSVAGSVVAALVIATTKNRRIWHEDLIPRLRLVGEVFANAVARKRTEESLQNALSEVKSLKERFEKDYKYLREEINLEHDFREVVGKSEALKKILIKVKQVAPTNAIVILLGETGTGKGLMARAIHDASTRKDRPLVQVNCATLTPTLIESELFGYEKGAFTGAQARHAGRFEMANGTTLFLDEIGELSLELQAKLLRVLQDGEFERVGGSVTVKTDVRVITATNKDLAKEVEAGRFRRDLWYRLNIFPIDVPPLRERVEDIPLFVSHFVDKYSKRMGKKFDSAPQGTLKALQNYAWPGNIRELENVIERAIITSPEGYLQIEVPACAEEKAPATKTLRQLEKDHILETLGKTGWVIEGPRGAATALDLNHGTLRSRMKKLGIHRP